MCRMLLIFLLILLLSGCIGLPTLETAPTPTRTTVPSTQTATDIPMNIMIIGDVYVRDSQGKVTGWLYKGDQVQALCSGDWCVIYEGSFKGYRFWRGCSSDNQQYRSCQAK